MNFNLIFVTCSLILYSPVLSLKLNVPRVLLPIFNDFSSKFTLEATEGGCYKWSTTRNDIISLQQVDISEGHDCSPKVIVHTITKKQNRDIAVVLAEDVDTQVVLRCDVIVDVIEGLSIVTTTKELLLDEAPEAFEVRAYDKQDNEFTSLEGVEFDWKLTNLGRQQDVVIIQFMSFKESPYETPPSVAELEKVGKRGNIVLLEGVKTGSAEVSVKMLYEEYKHIEPNEVVLSVLENMIVQPAEAFIMVGDTVEFHVIQLVNGRIEQLQLPNAEYYLFSDDETIAVADPRSGDVTGVAIGFTNIILRNKNMDAIEDVTVKLPAARVSVVTAAYMTFTLLPHRNWATIISQHHDIVAEVWSSDNEKIHLGRSVEIRTQIGEIFHVQERSHNGSWATGWAKKEGIAKIHGSLDSIVSSKLGTIRIEPGLSAQAELLVHPPIILTPDEMILPWDPKKMPKYKIDVSASGGDGEYLWSSSDHSVGVVTQTGNVRTQSFGTFEVSAAMKKNHHNREYSRFHILQPTRLEIVEFAMEAEVGTHIYLHVALYTDKPPLKCKCPGPEIPFSLCQDLPFKVKFSSQNFFYNKTSSIKPVGISCGNVAVIGTQVGTSKITVSYTVGEKVLEDTVSVSTFKPLELVYPRTRHVVLAVGSSTNLLFKGGPRPISGRPSTHICKVNVEKDAVIDAKDVSKDLMSSEHAGYIAINVLCLKLGESDVTLTVINTPSQKNCKNQEGGYTITVICGKPRRLFLQPAIYSQAGSCPMDLSAQRVVVQSKTDIKLTATVIDENGLPFLNISTLNIEWAISPPESATIGMQGSAYQHNVIEVDVAVANKSYQVIIPKADTGVLQISAKVVGYHIDKLKANKITPEYPEFVTDEDFGKEIRPPEAQIELYLVTDATVTPNIISIYNHPDNIKRLLVKQGSGHFEVAQSDAEIAELNYLEGRQEIEIIPKKEGDFRIRLTDLCLAAKPCTVSVEIVSVRTIRVEMSDKVEIGKCISCIVRLYDASDNLIDVPNLNMLDLSLHLDDDVAKFKMLTEDGKLGAVGEIHYVVSGLELGETQVTFSVNEVRSAPITLQVFPPLKIYPRNITLLLGSVLQLSTKGGPQPDTNMEYSMNCPQIAEVSNTGLVTGLVLGRCKVTAQAVGVNPTTGSRVVYSNDTVVIAVVPITGIKISMPLTRFKVGAVVPAWCSGLPEQLSPVVLGTVQPPMRFEWEVQEGEIIRIHTPLEKYGVENVPEDNVAIRIIGLRPGRTTLQLTASISGAAAKYPRRPKFVFSTSIDIEVFEHLVLTNPKPLADLSILMAPHSSTQLQTNLDSLNKITFSLLSSHGLPSEDEPMTDTSLSIPNQVVTLSDSGLLESKEVLGRVMIVVAARDDFGLKQTLSLIVEVKPIYYMLLHVIAEWRITSTPPAYAIPLGTDFLLQATYHDNTGSPFTVGAATLGIRTSRFDLTHIRLAKDNTSVAVSVRKPGPNVVKVWADGQHKTADYIKLNIAQLISPALEYLVTGDILCMWTPLVSTEERPARWSSSERKLLTLDSESGIGQVTSIRGGQVVIAHTLHPSASLNLRIFPASEIQLIPDSNRKLTNSPSMSAYRIPLVLVSAFTNRDKNLLSGWPCESEVQENIISYAFTCHMEFTHTLTSTPVSSIFSIEGSFNHKTGRYSCNIQPESMRNPNISTLQSNIIVWAELIGSDVKSERIELTFVPSIYVEHELMLNDKYKAELVIYGLKEVLDKVQIKPADEHLLRIDEPQRPESHMLVYGVTLIDYHWKLIELAEPLSLIVTSGVTGETIRVYVKLLGDTELFEKCPVELAERSFFGDNRNLVTIIVSMLIIFLITFYAYSHYFQPTVNVNVSTDTPRSCGPRHSTPYSPDTSCNPCLARHYLQMQQQSGTPSTNPRCGPYPSTQSTSREPVYGDPNSFYSTSPDIRRCRRYM